MLRCSTTTSHFEAAHPTSMAQSSRRCYCSVPCCYNNKQKFPYLSFHDFPVDAEMRAHWVSAIKRNEGPSFKILRGSTYVCSQHFVPDDMYVSANGRIRIKQGAVPSRFYWNDWGKGRGSQVQESVKQQTRKQLSAAFLDDPSAMPVPEDCTEEALLADVVAKDHDYTTCYQPHGKLDIATRRIEELELQVWSLENQIQHLTARKHQPLVYSFCITDEDFSYYTKFKSKEAFTAFWRSVYPSAVKHVYWSKAQETPQETQSPQRRLPLIDEFFMFLCCVAAGLPEGTLSSIFEVSLSTVNRTILTWSCYLYQVLGSLPLWMTKEKVQATMPEEFKLSCPEMRVIIDSTEIHCETASSLSPQSETLSNNQNYTTFKGLIGIAPCGVITFVSKLNVGSISETEITEKSQILQLLEPGDGVMATKGFLNEEMLSKVGATLIDSPLEKSTQLSMEDAEKAEAIAHLRIIAERAMHKVKDYRIWDGLVPLSMAVTVNQLWVVCCIMSNYQGLDNERDQV